MIKKKFKKKKKSRGGAAARAWTVLAAACTLLANNYCFVCFLQLRLLHFTVLLLAVLNTAAAGCSR
jgi:hypothetical protein